MKAMICIVALTVVVSSILVLAQKGFVIQQFFTGQMFLSLSQDSKTAYAAGLADGMFFASAAPNMSAVHLKRFGACTNSMTIGQMAAILEKELRDKT